MYTFLSQEENYSHHRPSLLSLISQRQCFRTKNLKTCELLASLEPDHPSAI